MLFRILLLILIGYFFIKIFKKFFTIPKKNEHIRGKGTSADHNVRKKYGGKIEDADFEEME